MGWPQYTYLALVFMSLGMNLVKHGEPKNDNYNFYSSAIGVAIVLVILECGGFFG
jgi:hypothetical protein